VATTDVKGGRCESANTSVSLGTLLENPTCRSSTFDAIRLGIEPNPDIAATLQERA